MNKNWKKYISLACAAMLSLSMFGCGMTNTASSSSETSVESSSSSSSSGGGTVIITPTKPTKVTNKTYQSYWMRQHDYKTMPIAAFNGAPIETGNYTKSMITDEHYKRMSECYFNTSYALYDNIVYTEDVVKTLEYAAKYNISYLAGGSGFDSATSIGALETQIYKTLLNKNNHLEALGGVLIRDEPHSQLFERMATSRSVFEELLGEKMLYHSNLFPTYANEMQLYSGTYDNMPEETYTYEQYVDDYLAKYQPQVLSYDYYPLQSNGKIKNGYLENMSIIRRKAAEAEIPFWVYVQSASWNTGVPTEADLHWLVNTSLAYGCKGIQYFTYVVPVSNAVEKFHTALIDHNGEPTEVYYYAQTINKFITEVDEVLMCSLNKGIMIAGSTPCDIPEEDVIASYGALEGVDGECVIVGCFDHNGKDAYYVINNSVDQNCTATLTFNKTSKGYVHTYTEKTDFTDKDELEISLGAGKAALVVLD